VLLQGLERLSSGETPLPAAAAAVDITGSLFTGWSSWLGGSSEQQPATAGEAAGGKQQQQQDASKPAAAGVWLS
jgi:hypothetical protein